MQIHIRAIAGTVLATILAGCGTDPYERLVYCKKLLHQARSCADAEPWNEAVERCQQYNGAQVASLQDRLDQSLSAGVWQDESASSQIVPASTRAIHRATGPREIQRQLGAARARLESCANPDSIAGALARGRGCRERAVATWDDDRKFEYEVCNEFIIDARHRGIEGESVLYHGSSSH